MAVMITDLCINCDACIDECPATAIVSADSSPRD
ncbi:MAG TPA: 4Fe-4S ferredoxin, partial [Sulfuricurvum sp.]|nr:4Fe-4S ferredoxin [Sulfuricurvum sp.]